MWKRFAKTLRCSITGEALDLVAFSEEKQLTSPSDARRAERAGIRCDADFACRVESGLLLAESARVAYPIARGLPVMLPYETGIHRQFEEKFARELRRFRPRYAFPDLMPERGEHAVLRAFSKEWAGYQYDGVCDVSPDDNQRRFIAEIGLDAPPTPSPTFLEVGCAAGLTTMQAHNHLKGDAVGVDLSLAVLGASRNFRANLFLHFVEASAFHLPFAPASFDVVYSRGVLHHTYSTHEAFKSVAQFTKPGGRFYLWV
jgi:SAM-dependent methyltransferase